jgi:hypothetical protein
MKLCLAVLVAAAACSAPPLTIELAIQSGSGATCPTSATGATTCTAIPLACPSMLLIRVVDPAAPEQPLIESCEAVTPDSRKDLCTIASVGIDPDALPASLPERTLEVQVAVLPVGSDGSAECAAYASSLTFTDVTGVPQSVAGAPPIAGHAYYHPGDATTVVELGCIDLQELNACVATNQVTVNASVVELDSQVSVSSSVAANLEVAVGEPTPDPSGSGDTFDPANARSLGLVPSAQPSWSADVDLAFGSAACLDVVDSSFGTAATLACTNQVAGKTTLDLIGAHISAARLEQLIHIESAADPAFDPNLGDGFVIGIVLDPGRNPVPNAQVSPDNGATVSYIAADGMSLQTTGTSRSGVFLSTDAPVDTTWSLKAALGGQGFGGLVNNKVTVVVIQQSNISTGP